MAVPKRRTSKQRQRKRRTHHRAGPVAVWNCPRCDDPQIPHRVCPTCGYYPTHGSYRDRPVIEVELD